MEVVSTSCVETDGVPTGGQLPGGSRKPPLLLIELQATKDGTKFVYNTSLPSVVQKTGGIFDNAIQKVRLCMSACVCVAVVVVGDRGCWLCAAFLPWGRLSSSL